ncbi:hypothetical protein A20C1_09584 [marine actinobacterium PHSC20C1]|nr:hypothetical protein A20C1_09584 [marine actinobacterium PHSC20C1]
MSDPRFRPRDFCADPNLFGKAEVVDWVSGGREEDHLIVAAKIQHYFAWRIRSQIKKSARPTKVYALASRTSYDRLMKMLRGETIMRLEDLGHAEIVLGVKVPLIDLPLRGLPRD